MKKASDDLFRLIKSLTKSEKGYFKKFASKNVPGGKSNYITLFDAIDEMDTYDEEVLKKKLEDQPFVNQISVYKVYLFNLVLKSLTLYGAFENTETKLAEMIRNAKILEKKQMHREAIKILKKAKEIAYKFDNEKSLLEILFHERNIYMVMPDRHVLEKRKEVYEEQKKLIERLSSRFHYSWLSDQMVMFVEQRGDYRNLSREREMEKIIFDPSLSSIDNAIGFSSKIYFYHILIHYQMAKENTEKFHEYLKKEIDLQEQYRHFIDENPKNYITANMNFLVASHIGKKHKDVKETLAKLAHLRKQYRGKLSPDIETEFFMQARNIELIIYSDNCELLKGRNVIKSLEPELKKYGDYVNPAIKITLLYNASYFCFIAGEFGEALRFLNKLLHEAVDVRSNVYNFAKVYNILIHYELGNFDHLEYIIENTYRYLKEKKSLFNVEKLLIGAIKKALDTADKEEIKVTFEELLYNLRKISHEMKSRQSLQLFDAISWAESKITGETFADVKRRSLKK